MSLYNMLFKENEKADKLLSMLALDRELFGRYRDVYLNADGSKIIVYTRCGGENREEYDWVFENMERHPNYISDYDDSYDETYCYFEFEVPWEYRTETAGWSTGVEPDDVHTKFEKAIAEMQTPGSEAEKRAKEVAKRIEEGIEANPQGGIIRL